MKEKKGGKVKVVQLGFEWSRKVVGGRILEGEAVERRLRIDPNVVFLECGTQ